MAIEVRLPQWGMGMQEGTVVRWLRHEGETVAKGDPLAEIESAKVDDVVPAPGSGVLDQILVSEGQTVPVRELLALIADHEQARAPGLSGPSRSRVPVAPRARRLAQQHGIDVGSLVGSGPAGRITEADVERIVAQTAADADLIPLTGMRGAIARRMRESVQTTAQVTLTAGFDVTELVRFASQQYDLSYDDLIIKACGLALRQHPRLNARIEGEAISLLPEVHIGFAVALDDGLIVPVVRDADRKSLREIAEERRRLAAAAKAGTVDRAEVTGSTFTVTNLGMFGVDSFTPIINPPEAATLGVGRITERPARLGDDLIWRQAVTLSLSFDHRLVDGAPAALFLQSVGSHLQDPDQLDAVSTSPPTGG